MKEYRPDIVRQVLGELRGLHRFIFWMELLTTSGKKRQAAE